MIIREDAHTLSMPEHEFVCLFCKKATVKGLMRVLEPTRDGLTDEGYRYCYDCDSCGQRGNAAWASVTCSSTHLYTFEMRTFGASFMSGNAADRLETCEQLLFDVMRKMGIDVHRLRKKPFKEVEAELLAHYDRPDSFRDVRDLLPVDVLLVALNGNFEPSDQAIERPRTESRWDFIYAHSHVPHEVPHA